jgi:hypothetical protein
MVIHGSDQIRIADSLIFESDSLQLVPEKLFFVKHLDELLEFEDSDQVEVSHNKDATINIRFQEFGDAPFGRPILSIPWTSELRPPINFKEAYLRDKQVTKRLTTEQKLLYQEAIDSLLAQGHAELLTSASNKSLSGHFIPVRPVFKTDRTTTKCRLCLDARILNKYTFTGTIVSETIISNLLQFKSHKHIAGFDLSKAFWQLNMEEHDKQYFSTVIMGRLIRFNKMIFGGTFSPSGLELALRQIKLKALEHLKKEMSPGEPVRPNTLSYCNYVDDFVVFANDHEQLKIQVNWLRWYLNQHGFPSDKLYFAGKDDIETTYLGYKYSIFPDKISAKPYGRIWPENKIVTRRYVTSLILSFYDPLGLYLRLQMAGRQLLRDVVQDNRGGDRSDPWKFPVGDQHIPRLKLWMEAARSVSLQFDRHVSITENIYLFCDSSSKAWVVEIYNEKFELVIAKGGLLPVGSTIPRGELLAIYQSILLLQKHFDILKSAGMRAVVCLTDNEPNVHRLRNLKLDRQLPIYERNRIQQIRQLVQRFDVPVRIQHIPGILNLADYATRFDDLTILRPVLDSIRLTAEITKSDAYYYKPEECTEESLYKMTLRSTTRKLQDLEKIPTDVIHVNDSNSNVDEHLRQNTTPVVPTDPPDPPLIDPQIERNSEELSFIEKLKINQETLDSELKAKLKLNSSGLWVDKSNRIYLQNESNLISELLERAHKPRHNGVHRTRYELKSFYWSNKPQNVASYVASCSTCAQVKLKKERTVSVNKPPPWVDVARQFGIAGVVGIDICQGVEGESHLITITCAVSKWIRSAPLKGQTANEVIAQLQTIFESSVFPRVIITDGGSCFKAIEMGVFCKLHGIIQLMTPSHASSYNGWFERSHQTVLMQLRLLRSDEPLLPWEQLLTTALHLVNSRPYDLSDEMKLCPLNLVYANSQLKSGIIHDPINESSLSILRDSGLDHLLKSCPDRVQDIVSELSERRLAALEDYLKFFEQRRSAIQDRLQKDTSEEVLNEDYLPVGSWVRVFKPSSGKITSNFSIPQQVVGRPSAGTRHVQSVDGKVQLVYVGNLVPDHQVSNNNH